MRAQAKKNSDKGSQVTSTDKKAFEQQRRSVLHSSLLYRTYLPAYLLATAADWLQGPYKYALYSSYGYTQRDIANLFVVGYGSGMILGSLVGGFADYHGRKKLCLIYCLSYTLSVLMKHCRHFYALMFGRLCGGIATSLLFSVFESWLIGAHRERGLLGNTAAKGEDSTKGEEKWLAKSLSVEMYGSSLVAIGSGIVANIVVENSGSMRPIDAFATYDGKPLFFRGGYITAFDACIVPLVLSATIMTVFWDENYGERASNANKGDHFISKRGSKYSNVGLVKKHSSKVLEDEFEYHTGNGHVRGDNNSTDFHSSSKTSQSAKPKERVHGALLNAAITVWNTPNILNCCIIGSLFESAMYIFIFLWTPALTSIENELNPNPVNAIVDGAGLEDDPHSDENLPFGWIFSSFMVCCMLGTIAFSHLSNAGVTASRCLVGVLALSSLSFLAMAAPHSSVSIENDANFVSMNSAAYTIQYAGMLFFEFCIGAYYPAMGTVKGTIVPEDQRAAIYNVFRFPMNGLVLVSLVWNLPYGLSFFILAMLMMVASIVGLRATT